MADHSVLIVGAGPTGLVLALWLTRLGVRIRIIDKAAEPGTASRALAVQARTLEFYRQLNLADDVVAAGVKVAGINLWVAGTRRARLPIQELGKGFTLYPFPLMYPQDEHERFLTARLEAAGVKVERGTELRGFDQNADGVRAVLACPGGLEEVFEAAYLAGCDGAHSRVREGIGAGFPGGTYTGVFYVADVDADGPALNHELHLELEEADFLAVFPLPGTGHARLIGVVSRESDGQPDLTFDDVGTRAIENLKVTVRKVNWFSTYRVHHRVSATFRKGRAFLLGDAAHVHSPVGGQGMNTGIGDAVNLAWKLASVLRGGASDGLLDTYEQERIGFAQRLVATTDRAFTFVNKQGPVARVVRRRVVPRLFPLLIRLGTVRRFMFRTVSQIVISYRGCALSSGAAGPVHGGDRLPWVDIGQGADNFAPLASVGWQVHVYGEASRDLTGACSALNLPLHRFGWQPGMRRAGLRRGAMYLVRPDGYVALADPIATPACLAGYFADGPGAMTGSALRG